MRTVAEVRLMVKLLLPMPPAFCAPVHAVVGAPAFPMKDVQKERGLLSGCWFFRELRSMPHCNYPNNIIFCFIKEPVRRYDHFSVGEFWEFRYNSSGFWEILNPTQDFFSLITKIKSRRRLILSNI
jgi:hypothetical protein